ncbi:MAG: crotonase/enoyl-CoA hydratase family protein [Candidatus Lambdaproteobacteria bacterium]|nr:crotonase/enoyl-CoA hydratase family protein [Candidatus Lambdaproteobacteria bacterium]
MNKLETMQVSVAQHVAHVVLDRPHKANAMNAAFWREIREVFQWIDGEGEARVAVISANGRHFSAGIDLGLLGGLSAAANGLEPGRRVEKLRRDILSFQDSFSAIERCRKPVIAAVHGGCIGGGVDLVSACDLRYCTDDARFVIKEIDIGLTADVGTLQRLPHLIGDGMVREMAYTGRAVEGPEACRIGLVNRSFADRETLLREVLALAATIAAKSPLAIRGTKEMILYTRDHSVADSLNYVATWNAGMLSEADVQATFAAQAQQVAPVFQD